MGVRFGWSIPADDPTFAVVTGSPGFNIMAEPQAFRRDLKVG